MASEEELESGSDDCYDSSDDDKDEGTHWKGPNEEVRDIIRLFRVKKRSGS